MSESRREPIEMTGGTQGYKDSANKELIEKDFEDLPTSRDFVHRATKPKAASRNHERPPYAKASDG